MGKKQERIFMSRLFKLKKKEFSKVDKEWQWTYACLSPFLFNKKTIEYLTITDHYQIEHKEIITNELILEILANLPPRINPRARHGQRDIYIWEHIPENNKEYRLIFWFKDHTTNHLWIRNCYLID